MTATLICVLVTPCTPVSGMFSCNAAFDAAVIGGVPGFVVGTETGFDVLVFPHAAASSPIAAHVARIREAFIVSLPDYRWIGTRAGPRTVDVRTSSISRSSTCHSG